MAKNLFILNDPPYGTERSYNALRLAGALSKREGEEVKLFLVGDAASCAKAHQKVPQGYYNVEVMIHGTPEQVIDQIRALQTDIGLDYLLCAPVSHTSFTLFTEQVLPEFL